jgi:hypothetical protein
MLRCVPDSASVFVILIPTKVVAKRRLFDREKNPCQHSRATRTCF